MVRRTPRSGTRKRRLPSFRPPTSISDYFASIDGLLPPDRRFWYRGHADQRWELKPSALRPVTADTRRRALKLVQEFKRLGVMRLTMPPPANDELQWVGIAQHYGLPTRLLDWTENPAIALYFATRNPDADGEVIILNPIDLNRPIAPREPRIFDPGQDRALIETFFGIGSHPRARKRSVIAINPVYNSERITLQKGTFTLHGDLSAALDATKAPSLVSIPVLKQHKAKLAAELARIGIEEMSIFPEPEHLCAHLRRALGL